MTLEGTIQNGVVVLDDKHQLTDGTRVEVVVRERPTEKTALQELLLKYAGTIDDLPTDMAKNHDHYIHGAPQEMTSVFADTFYFFTLLNKKDQAHDKAVQHATSTGAITTTEWVMTELADGIASTGQRNIFIQFRQEFLETPNTNVLPFHMKLYEKGLQLYASRPDKDWSLTDCISFVVMQHHSIHEALTGDHHFEQAGFVALLK